MGIFHRNTSDRLALLSGRVPKTRCRPGTFLKGGFSLLYKPFFSLKKVFDFMVLRAQIKFANNV